MGSDGRHILLYGEVLQRNKEATKRTFLSDFSMLFDPLGWLAPTLILPKILMQLIWIQGIEWDTVLPKDINDQWVKLRKGIQRLEKIRIPRWLGLNSLVAHKSSHGFSYASEQAYAAVIYQRTQNTSGDVMITILAARSKVAPISLPRLELCGAQLLVKLMKKIVETYPIQNIQAYENRSLLVGATSIILGMFYRKSCNLYSRSDTCV